MDDTKLFARESAALLKKSVFVANAKSEDVDLRIDVMMALLGRYDAKGMGTLGPGSPHEGILHYLKNRPSSPAVSAAILGL